MVSTCTITYAEWIVHVSFAIVRFVKKMDSNSK